MDFREQKICELFGDSKGFLPKARLEKYALRLQQIPTDKLVEFSIFADSFRENYQNTDMLLNKALNEWGKLLLAKAQAKGLRYFQSVDGLAEFCKKTYKEQLLCNCGKGSGFKDFVIISVDSDGNLRNNFVVLDNGTFQRLTSDETAQIFNWLFENQHKIGNVEYINPSYEEETPAIEHKQELIPQNKQVASMVKQLSNKLALKRA
ncbi:hypothetical protein CPIN18021_0326 [Campylobacter pinnipediorum subsp. caledonicus]|uniref:Uncharacterized protein n=1 Tax=Campylobacter pinnipediorum subsp. caledonicus TaxID=1874362 RepID=A0A1S6U634_9BACT|nr:hypothetical protein [Campylobacter pinnipediorum]AQW85569.1 hypothetical protein CPIN18020_0328 [Campylobacter pinnipediorum subsp. caledonicus]AQW87173.1 hypothetical protein CPIN18021_0326 [Campylobacter pinnipediorum subsp. caledonicus]OPA71850.1 hypothetical protein BB381_06860 [Campylobacter pinnipediorum subsp. caledonicus]